jgi:hypothetical protein
MLPGMNGFQKPARDSNPESPDDSVDNMMLKKRDFKVFIQ